MITERCDTYRSLFTGIVEYFPKNGNQFVSYLKGTFSKLEWGYFFRHWIDREILYF